MNLKKDGLVPVGTVLNVDGGFEATCKEPAQNSAQHGPDDEGSYLYGCNKQSTDVTVTCHGACIVSGTRVTVTGAGRLAVQVELTANGRRAVNNAVITAVAPEGFTLGPCLGERGRGGIRGLAIHGQISSLSGLTWDDLVKRTLLQTSCDLALNP